MGNLQSSVLTPPTDTVYCQLPRWNRFRGRHLDHSSISGWLMLHCLKRHTRQFTYGRDQASVVGLLHHPNADASGALVSAS